MLSRLEEMIPYITAAASCRLTSETVDAYRAIHPERESLLAATAWASFAATRRISRRLGDSPRQGRQAEFVTSTSLGLIPETRSR